MDSLTEYLEEKLEDLDLPGSDVEYSVRPPLSLASLHQARARADAVQDVHVRQVGRVDPQARRQGHVRHQQAAAQQADLAFEPRQVRPPLASFVAGPRPCRTRHGERLCLHVRAIADSPSSLALAAGPSGTTTTRPSACGSTRATARPCTTCSTPSCATSSATSRSRWTLRGTSNSSWRCPHTSSSSRPERESAASFFSEVVLRAREQAVSACP